MSTATLESSQQQPAHMYARVFLSRVYPKNSKATYAVHARLGSPYSIEASYIAQDLVRKATQIAQEGKA